MNTLLESLTKSLTEQGWKVEMQENNQIPAEITQRYDLLPTDYIYFLRNMKACVNSAETVWMLWCAPRQVDSEIIYILRMKILPAYHMVLGAMQPVDGHGLP